MIQILVETIINADQKTCFDLARDVDVHAKTAVDSAERIVGGRLHGKLKLGDSVTFEATHFGIKQQLTGKIVQFDDPNQFTDEMVKGAFKSLRHVHRFESRGDQTIMVDELQLVAPFGPLGIIAERLFLGAYMRRFLVKRGQKLKEIAEGQSNPSAPNDIS